MFSLSNVFYTVLRIVHTQTAFTRLNIGGVYTQYLRALLEGVLPVLVIQRTLLRIAEYLIGIGHPFEHLLRHLVATRRYNARQLGSCQAVGGVGGGGEGATGVCTVCVRRRPRPGLLRTHTRARRHMHACTHKRMHARTHARTYTDIHTDSELGTSCA